MDKRPAENGDGIFEKVKKRNRLFGVGQLPKYDLSPFSHSAPVMKHLLADQSETLMENLWEGLCRRVNRPLVDVYIQASLQTSDLITLALTHTHTHTQ